MLLRRMVIPLILVVSLFAPHPLPSSASTSPSSVQPVHMSATVLQAPKPVQNPPLFCAPKVGCHSHEWWVKLLGLIQAEKTAQHQTQLLAFYGAMSIPYHTGTYHGYACGGALPACCTIEHESNGDPWAVNPGHAGAPYGDPGDPSTHASGLFQDMPGTWNGWGGYPYAAAAPVLEQYKMNAALFAARGPSPWYGDGCYDGR